MVQYLYANDADGRMVDIRDVTHANRAIYYCPMCGTEMSAVLGDKRERHFRHKGDSCSYESYLHKITKLRIKQLFDESAEPFEISYYVTKYCPNEECLLRRDDCGYSRYERVLERINLKDYYNACEIEGVYKGFRADVMLINTDRPDRQPLFIEVAVSHKCTPEKINSGIRIIEISITNERDIVPKLVEQDPSKDSDLKSDYKVKFYNFNFRRDVIPEKQLSRFLVYKGRDGYMRGEIEREIGVCSKMIGIHKEGAYFEIQFIDSDLNNKNWSYIWSLGMIMAVNRGLGIRNCHICYQNGGCTTYKYYLNLEKENAKRTRRQFYDNANGCSNYIFDSTLKRRVDKYMRGFRYFVSREV